MDPRTRGNDPALGALLGVTIVGALGCLVMAVAHAGLEIPVVSALGPGGDRAVPQAAAGFAVGGLLYTAVAAGLARRRSWAWASGLVVNALVVLAAAMPFRGAGSAAGILVGIAGLALLLMPAVRAELLPAR